MELVAVMVVWMVTVSWIDGEGAEWRDVCACQRLLRAERVSGADDEPFGSEIPERAPLWIGFALKSQLLC